VVRRLKSEKVKLYSWSALLLVTANITEPVSSRSLCKYMQRLDSQRASEREYNNRFIASESALSSGTVLRNSFCSVHKLRGYSLIEYPALAKLTIYPSFGYSSFFF
jgi:hypothetical protein